MKKRRLLDVVNMLKPQQRRIAAAQQIVNRFLASQVNLQGFNIDGVTNFTPLTSGKFLPLWRQE